MTFSFLSPLPDLTVAFSFAEHDQGSYKQVKDKTGTKHHNVMYAYAQVLPSRVMTTHVLCNETVQKIPIYSNVYYFDNHALRVTCTS